MATQQTQKTTSGGRSPLPINVGFYFQKIRETDNATQNNDLDRPIQMLDSLVLDLVRKYEQKTPPESTIPVEKRKLNGLYEIVKGNYARLNPNSFQKKPKKNSYNPADYSGRSLAIEYALAAIKSNLNKVKPQTSYAGSNRTRNVGVQPTPAQAPAVAPASPATGPNTQVIDYNSLARQINDVQEKLEAGQDVMVLYNQLASNLSHYLGPVRQEIQLLLGSAQTADVFSRIALGKQQQVEIYSKAMILEGHIASAKKDYAQAKEAYDVSDALKSNRYAKEMLEYVNSLEVLTQFSA
jgi:hypothetical protein